jgi:DnaK suppressor protein
VTVKDLPGTVVGSEPDRPSRLSPEFQDHLRELLCREQAMSARLVESLRDELATTASDDSTQGVGPATDGVRQLAEEFTSALITRTERLIGEMRAALGRMALGTFGACEYCGESISEAKLEGIPWDRFCTNCRVARPA